MTELLTHTHTHMHTHTHAHAHAITAIAPSYTPVLLPLDRKDELKSHLLGASSGSPPGGLLLLPHALMVFEGEHYH